MQITENPASDSNVTNEWTTAYSASVNQRRIMVISWNESSKWPQLWGTHGRKSESEWFFFALQKEDTEKFLLDLATVFLRLADGVWWCLCESKKSGSLFRRQIVFFWFDGMESRRWLRTYYSKRNLADPVEVKLIDPIFVWVCCFTVWGEIKRILSNRCNSAAEIVHFKVYFGV